MKRPLAYYAVSLFLGCIFTLMVSLKCNLVGVAIAASFFIIMYFTIDKKFLVLILLFFICGVLSFNTYFHINIPREGIVRVIEKNPYVVTGDYKGRKIFMKGNVKELKEGEKLKVYGKFKKEPDFNRGIIGSFSIEKYEVHNADFIYNLYDIKRVIYEKLEKPLGEERTALVMALCYGDTRYLSRDQKNDFQKMGVVHAVSVSGFHMAIIYKVLEKIVGLKLAIAISFLYLLFTGLQAATIRSFIMILIFKLSSMVFKDYDSISSLSMSALVILFIKPYYVADLGFMLSFSATLGIIIYYRSISKLLYKIPKFLNESLSVSLSSQIFSVPYIAFTIQNFSSGFILGNVILLPLYSVIVVLGNFLLLFLNIDFILNILIIMLKFVINSIEGANYYILKCCPPVSYLGYLEGIALVMIYISYILYKYKNKNFKYMPFFILLIFLIKDYTFIPQIYHINLVSGEAVIIKYHKQNTMVCNYDRECVKDLIALKEDMKINKVFTNPKSTVGFKLSPHIYGDILLKTDRNKSIINVCCGKNDFKMGFSNNENKRDKDSIESERLYVIIFNRVIRMN